MASTYSVPSTILCVSDILLAHLIPTTALWESYYYYPHFRDEEIEVQKTLAMILARTRIKVVLESVLLTTGLYTSNSKQIN